MAEQTSEPGRDGVSSRASSRAGDSPEPNALPATSDHSAVERTLMEEKARASEQRCCTLIDLMPAGVYTVDAGGVINFYNPQAAALWGRSPVPGDTDERFCGSAHLFRADGSRLAHDQTPVAAALQSGEGVRDMEVVIERPDGSRIHVRVNIEAIRDAAGTITGAINVFHDFTARFAVEQAVKESEVRYRRLFQTAKDGILILDANTGKITDSNAFMAGLVGMESTELLGKELYQIGMFKDVEENKQAFRELQRTGYLRHDHLPVGNRRGKEVEVEFVANVYQEGDKMVAQCNVRDIGERSRMEKQIAHQAEELAEQSLRKDEFLAMLSHELRNPLAPIRSAVHLLRVQARPGSENPIQKQAREIIERQVGTLTKLIGDLLEVSRVVTGRVRLDRQALDLDQVVLHAIETVQPLIDQHRHTLVVKPCTAPVWVNADATRLEEVFVNLLNNAAKYTPDGGEIHVECEHHSSYALVRVRDNGVGIDAKLLPRIFDLFTQADRSLDRAHAGLGIGLSLAHRLVELHGGAIFATSEGPGKGAEIVVRLPLTTAPELLAPALPGEALTEPVGRRVLLVDDNMDQALMLSIGLRHKGFNVRTAHDGPGGLKLAQQWLPEIILLDIGLPGLNGYEVARRLRADLGLRDVKIIALTGYGRDSDIALAHEAGFDAHLTKPFEFDDLHKLMAAPAAPQA